MSQQARLEPQALLLKAGPDAGSAYHVIDRGVQGQFDHFLSIAIADGLAPGQLFAAVVAQVLEVRQGHRSLASKLAGGVLYCGKKWKQAAGGRSFARAFGPNE